jgi:GNAT superfamily N-acetyltransferase
VSSVAAPSMRLASAEDVDAIRELVRAAYAKWVPVVGREPRPMTAAYQDSINRHRFDLLHADTKLIAQIETAIREDHLWIENLAVLPEYQGRGYGRRLSAHAEQLAAGAGLSEVRLLTNAAFEANVRLYEAVGYQTTSTEPFMGGTTLYMSKQLSRP